MIAILIIAVLLYFIIKYGKIYSEKKALYEQQRMIEFEANEFDYKYENKITKYTDDIDILLDFDGSTKENERSYKKALSLAEKFKDFSYSKGIGGKSYFDKNYGSLNAEIESRYQEYLVDTYPELLAEEEEDQEYIKLVTSLKKQLTKIISADEYLSRSDITKNFDASNYKIIVSLLDSMSKEGILEKKKQSNKWVYKKLSK